MNTIYKTQLYTFDPVKVVNHDHQEFDPKSTYEEDIVNAVNNGEIKGIKDVLVIKDGDNSFREIISRRHICSVYYNNKSGLTINNADENLPIFAYYFDHLGLDIATKEEIKQYLNTAKLKAFDFESMELWVPSNYQAWINKKREKSIKTLTKKKN